MSAHWYLMTNIDELFSHSLLQGVLFILITEVNLLIETYSIQFMTVICIVTSAIILSYTFIIFVRLQQVNQIIYGRKFNIFLLNRFVQYHTMTIIVILRSNKFYGRILLSFIANQVIINTYLLILMLIGQFGLFGSLIFGNLIVFQNLAIFIFHKLGGMFTKRIHRCRRPLYNWSSGHALNRLHFVELSNEIQHRTRVWTRLWTRYRPDYFTVFSQGLIMGFCYNLLITFVFPSLLFCTFSS